MTTPKSSTNAVPNIMVFKILSFAMFFSTLLFMFLLANNPDMQTEFQNPMGILLGEGLMFAVLAVPALVLAIVIPNFMSKKALARLSELPSEHPQKRSALFTPFILRLALAESVALYGFVAAMTTMTFAVAIPFFIVTWAIMLATIPTQRRLDSWIARGHI